VKVIYCMFDYSFGVEMDQTDYTEFKIIFERMVSTFEQIEVSLANISSKIKIVVDEYKRQNL